MSSGPGRELSVIVRVVLALTLFNSWVLFEETVVDRLGWWRYMPCYRVGHFCEWDVAALVAILTISVAAFEDTRQGLFSLLRRLCAHLACPVCRVA
jgi:hypothetical protein